MISTGNLVTEPRSSVSVRFQDCDPFGHLNHARYVDYFMNAREQHITEHYGVSIIDPERKTSWVVRQLKIAYAAPAALGETVLIQTHAIGFSEQTLRVECVMLDHAGSRLKAMLWFDFTHIDLASGRPTDHSTDMMRLLAAIGVDVQCGDDFDERFDTLRRLYRRPAEVIQAEKEVAKS